MADDTDDTVIVPPRIPASFPEGADLDRTIIGRQSPAPISDAPEPENERSPSGYYSFVVGDHPHVIVLDVPVYLGRRPSPPRIPLGSMPRLVRVPSPLKEVSATHLEVRQRGTSDVVTDLKSTNGSIVTIPGSAPRKLRQGESVVVSPGTLVDIGDGNIIHILPMTIGDASRQEGSP